jgi:histidine ammonia-lyase
MFRYGKDHLTASLALKIWQGEMTGIIDEPTRILIRKSASDVAQIAQGKEPVYGINTGFGPLCTTRISAEQTRELQENILMSHAAGIGEPIDDDIAGIMMVLKVHALSFAKSGIREETLDRILFFIEHKIIPVVPSQGSVGASGDLAPLAHLFLPLLGLGEVRFMGKTMNSSAVLAQFDLQPLSLGPKEGLALINGTQFIAAHAVLLVLKMQQLLSHADIIGAMMLEGIKGSARPFDARLHALRPYPGNRHTAQTILNLLHGSQILVSHADCARVQDPYSLRCMPQVHGASRQAWLHLKETLEIELNSVTDNPIVLSVEDAISGGNFHGQPLALPIDYACLAISEIGNISDRRIYLSLEGDTPGLPKLLMKSTGLNSGYMIPQYTAAALASENKGLCFPASADSIPTSLGQEDHVSMGSISGRKALRVLDNVEKILGIELFCAAQALDFHAPLLPGRIVHRLHQRLREEIPFLEQDGLMYVHMAKAAELVKSGALTQLAAQVAADEGLPYHTEWSSLFE